MKFSFRKTVSAIITAGLLTAMTGSATADTITGDVDADAVASPHANTLSANQAAGTTAEYNLSALIKQTGNANDDVFDKAGDTVTVSIARSGAWLATDGGSPASFLFSTYNASQSGTIRIAVPANGTGTQEMRAVFTGNASNGRSISGLTLAWKITATSAPSAPADPCDGAIAPAAPTFSETGGTLGDSNWWKAAPTISAASTSTGATITYSDAESGTYSTSVPALVEGVETTVWAKATNACGLSSTTSKAYKLDSQAPQITLSGVPTSFYFGHAPAAPSCVGQDPAPGSGLTGNCVTSGWNANAAVGGPYTVTGTQNDVAGNTGQSSAQYSVLAWTTAGFHQPVDMSPSDTAPVWNNVKNGSTVPLKFNVYAGQLELTDPATTVQTTVKVLQVACSVGSDAPVEELAATGGTSLRYDTTAGQFVFNWQTPKKAGSCYKASVMMKDNVTSVSAFFKLK